METIIGLAGIVVLVLTYFAGVQRGERTERERQDFETKMEEDRRLHDLASKLVDEYVSIRRRRQDSGLTALAGLGLHQLGDDRRIRDAIAEMDARTVGDTWSGKQQELSDVDLVAFFRYVRENRVDLRRTPVEEVIDAVSDGQIPGQNSSEQH